MQGVLKAFEPVMYNGQHSNFTGQYGLMYKFNVTLEENGVIIKGVANSTKQVPTWVIGAQYTYTTDEHQGIINIRGMKKVDDGRNASYSKKPDPTFLLQKAFEGAYECAFILFEAHPENYKSQEVEDGVVSAMYKFILSEPNTTEQKRWMNLSALRITLNKLKHNGAFNRGEEKVTDWVFNMAKLISDVMENNVNESLKNLNTPQ